MTHYITGLLTALVGVSVVTRFDVGALLALFIGVILTTVGFVVVKMWRGYP